MVLSTDKVTGVFYLVDEFCKELEQSIKKHTLCNPPKRKLKLSFSEIITIMVMFHAGGFRNMKHFYLYYLQKHRKDLF